MVLRDPSSPILQQCQIMLFSSLDGARTVHLDVSYLIAGTILKERIVNGIKAGLEVVS